MASNNFTVIYDACVLYPATLRDFLMHLARWSNLFKARWTDDIHDEWTRSVLMDLPHLKSENLARTRELMNHAVPDALIDRNKYKDLVASLELPDPDDRHVLAAAIASRAEIIVTFNLRDFPAAVLTQYDITGRHPDDFVMDLLSLNEDEVRQCLARQQQTLKNPPISLDQVLSNLEANGLRKSCARLR
jgi:hypothetical protein